MNGTSNETYIMQDPYVQGTNDPMAAAPGIAAQTDTPSAVAPQAAAGVPNMRHGLSSDVIGRPTSVGEAFQGALRGTLSRAVRA